jgi:hypothetical protein
MEKTYKKTYMISGRTKAGSYCSLPFCSSIEISIHHFIAKFPRFQCKGRIMTQMAEDCGSGLLMADGSKWETISTFESTKELKETGKQC